MRFSVIPSAHKRTGEDSPVPVTFVGLGLGQGWGRARADIHTWHPGDPGAAWTPATLGHCFALTFLFSTACQGWLGSVPGRLELTPTCCPSKRCCHPGTAGGASGRSLALDRDGPVSIFQTPPLEVGLKVTAPSWQPGMMSWGLSIARHGLERSSGPICSFAGLLRDGSGGRVQQVARETRANKHFLPSQACWPAGGPVAMTSSAHPTLLPRPG